MTNIRVPGVGPKDCKICLVGEAPGAEEDRQGKPFIGPSGKLLDRVLAGAGIVRKSCYVTNLIKERPKDNAMSHFIHIDAVGQESTDAYKWYLRQLSKELKETTANVFVPLGRYAMNALTGYRDITNRRGSVLAATLPSIRGRKVIPCIHPAAALRQYLYTYMMSADFKRIKAESEFPEIHHPERDLWVRPTYLEARAYLENILQNKLDTAVDIETDRYTYQVTCIAFAISDKDCMSIPFFYQGFNYFTVEEEAEIWMLIAEILEHKGIVKIFQNGAFDAQVLYDQNKIITNNMEDTMIGHGILYPDLPKSLGFMVSMLTDEPYYKDEGAGTIKGQYGVEFLRLNADERDDMFWRYNAKDAVVTFEILPKIKAALEKQGNLATYHRQRALLPILMYMNARGTAVDLERMGDMKVELRARAAELTKTLHEIAGEELNPNSPTQIKKYFYEKKKLPPYYKDKKITVDDDALKRISRKGFREAGIIREIRKCNKMCGTYLEIRFDEDKRIRGSYNPVGTKTGRISSSQTYRDTGGNQQNQPYQMKHCYVADPGCLLINIDLSQAENRIVAYGAPDPSMIKAFESGLDVHRHTFSLMFNMPIESVSDEPGSAVFGDGAKSQRYWGKQMNHSLNYDLKYRRFSLRFDLPEKEGNMLVERYHEVYPNVRAKFHYSIQQQLRASMTVTNPYGRVRRFMGRLDENLFQDAYAQFPQSTVADKINQDGMQFIWDNQEMFGPLEILNQVHDSLVLQVPISVGWNTIREMLQAIKDSLELPVPWKYPFSIPADISVGANLGKLVDVTDLSELERVYEEVA